VSKAFIIPIICIVGVAVPTIFGFIPPLIGVLALLLIAVLKDVIMMVFLRGLPMAMAACRMQGGSLWGVVKRDKTIKVGRIAPSAGMTGTKQHGKFTVVGSQMYSLDGVQIGLAPEDVGHNVGFDHVSLVNLLRSRGINNITDVCDLDEYGYFAGWKDDPRIKDLREDDETIRKLKQKYCPTPGVQIDLSGFNDFHLYTKYASSPYHQDLNIKQGIAQGLGKGAKGANVGLWVLLGVIAGAAIAFIAAFLLGNRVPEEAVRVVANNVRPVIPM
jgi:hypothetical protein